MRTVNFTPGLEELSSRIRSDGSELDGATRATGGKLGAKLLELPPETLVALLAGQRTEVPTGTEANEPHAAMVNPLPR